MKHPGKAFRAVVVASTTLVLVAAAPEAGQWKAPARAARRANPVAADAASVKAGRVVYVAECLDCHGRRGAGDGPGARDLKTKVPNLADSQLWRQSDGELFWKLSTGRGDMPGFEEMLGEDKRWDVLNYSRATFAPRDGTRDAPDGDANVAARREPREGKR